MVLWSLAKLSHVPPAHWVSRFLRAAALQLPMFSSQTFSCVLYSLARLKQQPDGQWLRLVLEHAGARMGEFTGQGLANMVYGVALMGYSPSNAWMDKFHHHLLHVAEEDSTCLDIVQSAYGLLKYVPRCRLVIPAKESSGSSSSGGGGVSKGSSGHAVYVGGDGQLRLGGDGGWHGSSSGSSGSSSSNSSSWSPTVQPSAGGGHLLAGTTQQQQLAGARGGHAGPLRGAGAVAGADHAAVVAAVCSGGSSSQSPAAVAWVSSHIEGEGALSPPSAGAGRLTLHLSTSTQHRHHNGTSPALPRSEHLGLHLTTPGAAPTLLGPLLADILSAYSADPNYAPSSSPSARPPGVELHPDGYWRFKGRVCVPDSPSLRGRAIQLFHDALASKAVTAATAAAAGAQGGQPCGAETLAAMAPALWWPNMARAVQTYALSCSSGARALQSARARHDAQKVAELLNPPPGVSLAESPEEIVVPPPAAPASHAHRPSAPGLGCGPQHPPQLVGNKGGARRHGAVAAAAAAAAAPM